MPKPYSVEMTRSGRGEPPARPIQLVESGPPPLLADPRHRVLPKPLFSYGGALRRYWLVVLATTLLAAGAALAVSMSKPKMYDATAKLLITTSEPIDVLSKNTGTRSLDPERDLNTGIELVKLDPVGESVRRKLRLPGVTTPQLLSEVSASPAGNSNVIAIKVRDRSPQRAATIADAFAQEYMLFRRKSARALYLHAAESARAQLAALSPATAAGAEGRELSRHVNELKVASTVQTGGAQLVNGATAPTSPATPRTTFNVAVGLFAGLFLGGLFALGLYRRATA
jgi:succinoglycan biosynthesis transport protein ExoP